MPLMEVYLASEISLSYLKGRDMRLKITRSKVLFSLYTLKVTYVLITKKLAVIKLPVHVGIRLQEQTTTTCVAVFGGGESTHVFPGVG